MQIRALIGSILHARQHPVYRYPRHVILLKKFPTTGSEKVNRIALRQLAEVELARIKLSLNSNHNKT